MSGSFVIQVYTTTENIYVINWNDLTIESEHVIFQYKNAGYMNLMIQTFEDSCGLTYVGEL